LKVEIALGDKVGGTLHEKWKRDSAHESFDPISSRLTKDQFAVMRGYKVDNATLQAIQRYAFPKA
jgi:hypothetical protein